MSVSESKKDRLFDAVKDCILAGMTISDLFAEVRKDCLLAAEDIKAQIAWDVAQESKKGL